MRTLTLCNLSWIQWIRERLQKVFSGKRKMKVLLRVVLEKEIKEDMVTK